jgi:hypothetical protein
VTSPELRNALPVLTPLSPLLLPAPLLRHGVASVLPAGGHRPVEGRIHLPRLLLHEMEDRLLRSRNFSRHYNEFVMGSLFTIVGRILPANARQMAACRIAYGFEAEIL